MKAEAARHLESIVDLLEQRGGPPFSEEALEALADHDGRARWAGQLDGIAREEAAAMGALRQALTADFPPGEDEF